MKIIKLILFIIIILFLILLVFFTRNVKVNIAEPVINTNPTNTNINPLADAIKGVWAKEIANIDVSPSNQSCSKSPTPSQTFSARLSNQAPGTKYKGTFLHLTGSPNTQYVFDIENPYYDGRRSLETELWKAGFRILEFKYSSKIGLNPTPGSLPDEQWRHSGMICQYEPFIKALKILIDENMWPKEPQYRFAMGTSNGAITLAYAVDYFKSPFIQANRILVQSPAVYDPYSQCLENPTSAHGSHYFQEQCQNPQDYPTFFNTQSLKGKLGQGSCQLTSGIDSYLIVFGQKDEVEEFYNDEKNRYIPDRERTCPTQTAWWEAPLIYDGHRPIESYFVIHGDVDPFLNYFLNGIINFD